MPDNYIADRERNVLRAAERLVEGLVSTHEPLSLDEKDLIKAVWLWQGKDEHGFRCKRCQGKKSIADPDYWTNVWSGWEGDLHGCGPPLVPCPSCQKEKKDAN